MRLLLLFSPKWFAQLRRSLSLAKVRVVVRALHYRRTWKGITKEKEDQVRTKPSAETSPWESVTGRSVCVTKGWGGMGASPAPDCTAAPPKEADRSSIEKKFILKSSIKPILNGKNRDGWWSGASGSRCWAGEIGGL